MNEKAQLVLNKNMKKDDKKGVILIDRYNPE